MKYKKLYEEEKAKRENLEYRAKIDDDNYKNDMDELERKLKSSIQSEQMLSNQSNLLQRENDWLRNMVELLTIPKDKISELEKFRISHDCYEQDRKFRI